jgi:hypothetical protein
MLRQIAKLCLTLSLTALLALTAVSLLQAQEAVVAGGNSDCAKCHEVATTQWTRGRHAKALSDPIFQQAWQERANDPACLNCHTTGFNPETGHYQAEGITCATCHSPVDGDHPRQVITTDLSGRLCGQCHLDTHAEWTISAHGQQEMSCIRCHNPHSTELRKSDTVAVCQTCHREESHFYGYTLHGQQNLNCIDCHLRVSSTTIGEGHGRRVHTFTVDSQNCIDCHADVLHYPSDKAMMSWQTPLDQTSRAPTPLPEGLAPFTGRAVITTEPAAVGPLGFAIITALVGIGSGIVIAPWLENWYRELKKNEVIS